MTGDQERHMDTLIRLTASMRRLIAIATCGNRPQKEKIGILALAGFTTGEIAEFLGTTPNTVSVALSTMRKEKKKGRDAKRPTRTEETGNG